MLATMRDTSRDYRTYWIRDGMYYGKASNLGASPCTLPPDKLAQIPEDDRKLLLDEIAGNPSFCAKVLKCMSERADWGHLIAASAKEAIVNELDHSKFKNRKGMWPKLRARTNELVETARNTVRGAVASMTFQDKVAALERLKGARPELKLSGLGSLGQWDIIASLVGTIGKVGSDIYTTNLVNDTREDIAKIQASSAINTLSAQQSIARAQAAMAASQAQQAAIQNPIGSAISTFTTSTVAGIPVVVLLAGGAIAIWYVLKGK